MKRRTFTAWLAAGAWAGRADEARDVSIYAADVEFLLGELPKHAGGFFAAKKIDWAAVSAEFREGVKGVKDDGAHLVLCSRLLARLRDGHAGVIDAKVPWPDEAKGRRWTGPRVHLVVIAERGVFVRAAFGEGQRLRPGQRVEKIDGRPAREWLDAKMAELRDKTGYSTDHQALHAACHWGLADWSGTPITFTVREGESTEAEEITIVRNGGPNFAPIGPIFPPKGVQALGRQAYGRTPGGLGYIHLRDVPGTLPEQLDTMLGALGDVRGLILDMRGNGGGGCDHAAVMGRFLPKGTFWGEYESAGEKPFTGRMVVIVDAGVRSAGETVAGLFLQESRAYGLGDTPTAGMSAAKKKLPVPSGLFTAYFAVRSHMNRWNKGRGLEGIGLAPTELLPYDPAELLRGVDTQIRRAEELLSGNFPPDTVDYEPPAGG